MTAMYRPTRTVLALLTAVFLTASCSSGSGSATPSSSTSSTSSSSSTAGSSTSSASTTNTFPLGAYQVELTVEGLEAAGLDAGTAPDFAATWTMTFDATGIVNIKDSGGANCNNVYRVDGVRVTIGFGAKTCPGAAPNTDLFSADFRLEGEDLRFTNFALGDGDITQEVVEAVWGSQPWQKIG